MTPGRLKIWNNLAGAWEYTPGGGSQSVRVVGPFSLDWADWTTNKTVTLFTPAAGDILLDAFVPSQTAVDFDDTGSIDFGFNESPPDADFASGDDGFWGFLGNTVSAVAGGVPTASSSNNPLNEIGGSQQQLCVRVFTGNPVKVTSQSANGDGAAGHADVYFVIATPVAPGGGSQPLRMVTVTFAYNTPNILTGIPFFTPAAGEVFGNNMGYLLPDPVFDGTAPCVNVFRQGDDPDTEWFAQEPLAFPNVPVASLLGITSANIGAGGFGGGYGAFQFPDATPVLIAVRQESGGDPNDPTPMSQGSATLVLFIQAAP